MRKISFRLILLQILISALFSSCNPGGRRPENAEEKPLRVVEIPRFNRDSAYFFIEKQVGFGPRIPNTPAHQKTADYLVKKFKEWGATTQVQEFESTVYDGQKVKLKNIIASYFPKAQKRILLAAHWDTRPFADKDSINKGPFQGANDGASGVGILMEVARSISLQKNAPSIGVDIILFDGEDWGEHESYRGQSKLPEGLQSWYCLGSQHWAHNKHQKNYSAYYGILLDMAGSKGAKFYREGLSLEYANRIVEKVWDAAARNGFSNYFVKQNVGGITDDHKFVNEIAKIPMIDIVHYDPKIGFFGNYHHSQKDNISLIDKETLEAVGVTLINVVYYEE